MKARGYGDAGELSPRMRQVLQLAAGGHTVPDTAALLHVSVYTVRATREAACVRLEASNVTAAVATAIREGRI